MVSTQLGARGATAHAKRARGHMWSARLGARGATAQAKRASARGYMACGATTKKSLGGAGSWMSHGIHGVWGGGGQGGATTSTVGIHNVAKSRALTGAPPRPTLASVYCCKRDSVYVG